VELLPQNATETVWWPGSVSYLLQELTSYNAANWILGVEPQGRERVMGR